LDGEPEPSEGGDGAGLSALEVTRSKALTSARPVHSIVPFGGIVEACGGWHGDRIPR
jgi:hypothetical protein